MNPKGDFQILFCRISGFFNSLALGLKECVCTENLIPIFSDSVQWNREEEGGCLDFKLAIDVPFSGLTHELKMYAEREETK